MQPKSLASLIHFHRKRAELNQTELAAHAGVSRYVVQDLEAAGGRTTLTKLLAVLNALSIDLEPKGALVGEWKESVATRTEEGSDNE